MTDRGKTAASIYRSILKWLFLVVSHEIYWLTLLTGHDSRKVTLKQHNSSAFGLN